MPQTSLLGFGFSVFGTMDLASGTTQSIIAADDNTVTAAPDQPTVNNTYTFTSREQVTSHFAASVETQASGFGFDGEFSAKYGSESESSVDTVYGLYNALSPIAITKLASLSENNFASGFATDPDVLDIPDTYTKETAEAFFRVFKRYGTHFVSEVTIGGRLNAYTTAKITKETSRESAESAIKLEYEALFGSASAQASADWGKIGTDYSNERRMHYETIGGNPSALEGFVPEVGVIENAQVGTWLATVAANPEVIDFKIDRISKLFTGPVGTEVDKAFDAYLRALIRVEAWELLQPKPSGGGGGFQYASTIALPGGQLIQQPECNSGKAPEPSTAPQWLWLMLLDPTTQAFLNGDRGRSYFLDADSDAAINADISKVLSTVTNPLVAICMEGEPRGVVRVPLQLRELLESCGGYDLQAEFDDMQEHSVLSIVGLSGSSIPATVTSAITKKLPNNAGIAYTAPSRTTVQYLDQVITVLDQDGISLSPVNA